MAERRFWQLKTVEDEERYVVNAIPTSKRYKNKWRPRIFDEWREGRFPKVTTLEPGCFFFLKNMIYTKFSRWKFLFSSNGCFKCLLLAYEVCSRSCEIVKRKLLTQNVIPRVWDSQTAADMSLALFSANEWQYVLFLKSELRQLLLVIKMFIQ